MLAARRFLLATLTLCGAAGARGDVFELKDGGQIAGELLARDESGLYRIRTPEGAELTLERNQLKRHVPQNETVLEYQRRSRTAPDTADAHRELVAWCREHNLLAEADHHLRRVVELDPEDQAARESLDMRRVGDEWVSREEEMKRHGLKFYDGKWRTPQDIAIRERDNQAGEGAADWLGELRKWRNWLDNRRDDRVQEALAQIAALNDPQATPALVKLLDSEDDEAAFDLLLAALGRLDHPLAVQTLVDYSLNYDDGDRRHAVNVRDACLDYLVSAGRSVSILPFVQALKSKDNVIVNRAGLALERIGEPAAISPLIDALVTTHKYQVAPDNSGQMNASFDPSGQGGGGLSMGGGGPKIVTQDEQNIAVRLALVKLSGGQNFDFDEVAWRHWFVDMLSRQHANSRRDE
jgi:hypothetical protein